MEAFSLAKIARVATLAPNWIIITTHNVSPQQVQVVSLLACIGPRRRRLRTRQSSLLTILKFSFFSSQRAPVSKHLYLSLSFLLPSAPFRRRIDNFAIVQAWFPRDSHPRYHYHERNWHRQSLRVLSEARVVELLWATSIRIIHLCTSRESHITTAEQRWQQSRQQNTKWREKCYVKILPCHWRRAEEQGR